jgi:hypothetical protein
MDSLDEAIALLRNWNRRSYKTRNELGSAKDLVEAFERLCGELNLKTKRSESERLRLETAPAVSISWTKRDDVIYFVHPVRGGERIFQLSFFPPGRVTCLDRSGETFSGEPLEVLVDQVIKRLEGLSKVRG